ncbi:MAG: efflux RND transporter periplasmic adaptor subunit [Labilithrix sp.]|nr:efflux RND transporter periplasmic adaptor subunit [Labilithrix sp.]MCW5811648.1 efflux RND transporter periplasmic adaptor subunit [Labilithrix sp.]
MKRAGCILLLIAGCSTKHEAPPAPSDAAAPVPTVDLVPVTMKTLDLVVPLEGELAPYERVAIYARANGFVQRVLVDRGTKVKQGQLLATLSAPELGAQRAEAEAKLAGDTSTYERLKAASATPGAVAGHEVEVAEASMKADQGRLDAIRAQEQYLTLTAPFDGVVTERGVHPGALVGPQVGSSAPPLLKIEQVHLLRLTVPVPETFVGGIADGAEATFAVRAFPGAKFKGVTKRVASSIDAKTRSMPVELDVDNADGRLAPGMFATVSWPVKRTTPTTFVPAGAIGQSTERTFVVRVKDKVAEQVPVQRGATQGDLVEVFGALEPTDTVAAKASEDLRTGTRVEVRAKKP